MKPGHLLQAVLLSMALIPCAAQAQSIVPDSSSATLAIGESITFQSVVTLATSGATTVDVFFLADNTGSMGSIVGQAQRGASAILNGLPSGYQFGVGNYLGDPVEGELNAYTQLVGLTADKSAVQAGINSWYASGGGDIPEANFYALQQVANTADWRPDAQHVIVWFGDARSHTSTTTQSEAIDALLEANVNVIAFNSNSAGNGIDAYGQASDIVDAVGGTLVNNFHGVSDDAFVAAVMGEIELTVSYLDLLFGSTFTGSGLELSFSCVDALGCLDVAGGESRTFELTITAVEAGLYDFNVFAQGVGAYADVSITVVPEPETYAMLLAGLGLVGVMTRRRRHNLSA
ncbi:MAG: PEPxxWA-CTERM sorting domain-containing protein [Betaproteobacteria bacterium]|nr:PEPxxWA-CTERM sorting domain-containing protein [Betaproteobacteria bacterium]